ncbi:HNH endonuclease [Marivita sp.]|uniref:HNH endonuclease n=1 Tax=Marivita sp. TaxID=2003365 RepID=UPI0026141BFF|nr:HNH endonuclease [Marivita sp.]
MSSRKQFIQDHGATCKNWQWSWSFINTQERFVIFGAVEEEADTGDEVILRDAWQVNQINLRREPGYTQAIEHIRLVEEQGYALYTYPVLIDSNSPSSTGGPAKIKSFERTLNERQLLRKEGRWIATSETLHFHFEGDETFESLTEGRRLLISVSFVERNRLARKICLDRHGFCCSVCDFNFEQMYGEIGKDFIHVHHLHPMAETTGVRDVNPVDDLAPVCPNCHSMLHRRNPPYSIAELKEIIGSHGLQRSSL